MIRNALLFLVFVLVFGTAACGGKPAGGTLGNTAAASKGGCPAATRVRIASWSSGAGSMEGSPKWRVPLVVRALEGDYEQFEQQRAQAAPISADALRAAGAETLPGTVWLFRDAVNGPAPLCAATIGAPYRAVGGDGAIYEELGVELVGCPNPTQEDAFVGWVSLDEPTGCALVATTDVASRAWEGETWDGNVAPGDPMPKELVGHQPPPPSSSPAGIRGTLWAARAAKVDGAPIAWELTTTHIAAPPGTEACSFVDNVVDHLDYFTMVGGAAVPVESPMHGRLVGVLAEGASPRVLLLHGSGDYATLGVDADGKPTGNSGAQYYIPHDEDFFYYSLAPYCGP
jgi:hypothetical protein